MRSPKILHIVSSFIGLFLVSACGATMVGGSSEGGAMTEGATHSADETTHVSTSNHFENDPPIPGSSQATGSALGGPSMPIAIASTHLSGSDVPGIQATDPSVPAGFAKVSRIRVHVADLSGHADASENEPEPNEPCVDSTGQILPQIFSAGERPYVFWRDSADPGTGFGPFGVETDDCGRRYITYVPEIQDNYNPLDPARSGCKGSAEVWATFKTSEGQILETDHQTVACTMEGGIFSLTLKFPPSEEIVMPVLRIIPQKIVKTIDPLVLKSFLPAPQ